MKRRIFVFLLSIFVVLFARVPVSASGLPSGFTLNDLNDYGLESLVLSRGPAPALDGVMGTDEYGAPSSFTENGLYYLSGTSCRQSADAKMKSAVHLSGDVLFLAISVLLPTDSLFPQEKMDLGSVYCVSFDLCLTPGDHPSLRTCQWQQDYFFSAEDLRCVGVSGQRVVSSESGSSRVALQISSLRPSLAQRGFTDEQGVLWNGEHYRNYAALSLSALSDGTRVTCEVSLPAEDALLSVPENQRSTVCASLYENKGSVCGGFSASLFLSQGQRLVRGIPTTALLPESVLTWDAALASRYGTSAESVLTEVIPAPLYLSGQVPVNVPEQENVSATTSAEDPLPRKKEESDQTPSYGLPALSAPGFTSDSELVEDETVFAFLPDEDEPLPEETQILPYEPDEEEENGSSFWGSLLTVLSGLLLLSAVVILVISDRNREKREEEARGTREKKKSTNKYPPV